MQGTVPCVQEQNAWGYSVCADEEAFVEQYIKTTEQFLACDKISGFCYTQLYDVEQEKNGFYNYERKPKLSAEAMQRIADCNRTAARIEKQNVR